MNVSAREIEGLRQAYTLVEAGEAPRGDCPPPQRLWAGAKGELTASEVRQLVEHTATCPACIEAWRLAREVRAPGVVSAADSEVSGTVPLDPPTGNWKVRRWSSVAAVAAVLLVGVALVWRPGLTPVHHRNAGDAALRSLLADDAVLPRHDFRLRWEGPAPDLRYDLWVSTETLVPIAEAHNLEAPQYRVREEALAGVPPGSTLLWRLEAVLPDGGVLRSETFLAQVD